MSDSGLSESDRKRGPSFSLGHKLHRIVWGLVWLIFCRFTPPPLFAWRRFVLRCFGAKMAPGSRVYGSCRIWFPPNLEMGENALMGRSVNCYNQGKITIGREVVVSQDTTLCASTHDVNDPGFPLMLRPVRIQDEAWIASEAFVGPGVIVGEGAVLGARGVAMRDLAPWGFYSGNPAALLKERKRLVR